MIRLFVVLNEEAVRIRRRLAEVRLEYKEYNLFNGCEGINIYHQIFGNNKEAPGPLPAMAIGIFGKTISRYSGETEILSFLEKIQIKKGGSKMSIIEPTIGGNDQSKVATTPQQKKEEMVADLAAEKKKKRSEYVKRWREKKEATAKKEAESKEGANPATDKGHKPVVATPGTEKGDA